MEKSLKVGLFYGSETGNTKEYAFVIKDLLSSTILEMDKDPVDMAAFDVEDLLEYDMLIFGSPTWNIGELQSDIGEVFDEFDSIDLAGKLVAIYGFGDHEGYPDTYQDAIGILGRKLRERGAKLIGFSETSGHHFEESLGIEEGKFMGLALDNDNQAELSDERLRLWTKQLISEVAVLHPPQKISS